MPEDAPVISAVLWGVGGVAKMNLQRTIADEWIKNPAPWCQVKWFDVPDQGYLNALTWHLGTRFRMASNLMKKNSAPSPPRHRNMVDLAGVLVVFAAHRGGFGIVRS